MGQEAVPVLDGPREPLACDSVSVKWHRSWMHEMSIRNWLNETEGSAGSRIGAVATGVEAARMGVPMAGQWQRNFCPTSYGHFAASIMIEEGPVLLCTEHHRPAGDRVGPPNRPVLVVSNRSLTWTA